MKPDDQTKLSREELYDLEWSKPLTTLAKEHGISDNGLRKICKKLPKAGHWLKLEHGKPIVVEKLKP